MTPKKMSSPEPSQGSAPVGADSSKRGISLEEQLVQSITAGSGKF